MNCEVCGRRIRGKSYRVIIERARLEVCSSCASLGSMGWKVRSSVPARLQTKRQKPLKQRLKTSMKRQSSLEPTLELVDDFDDCIRRGREAKGLSYEDLGRKIKEKVSVLKKLESQKMIPDNKLAEKLQYALKIKLLVPVQSRTENMLSKKLSTKEPQSRALTLGDLLKDKERLSEAKE